MIYAELMIYVAFSLLIVTFIYGSFFVDSEIKGSSVTQTISGLDYVFVFVPFVYVALILIGTYYILGNGKLENGW